MLDGEVAAGARVRLPLSMVNRHGLVAGATGTGKTKTLQILAGQLSDAGVPVFVSDVKGDMTGISQAGDGSAAPVLERAQQLGLTYEPRAHPVELLSLSGALGAQVRATVSSFGPLLLGKVLDLNRTQISVLTLVFAYCDDQRLPLLDLADLRTTLKFLASDEGKPALEEYGGFSKATVGVLLRSIVELEAAGADAFFGEPEFDVHDLMRATDDGRGVVSLLELSDVHGPAAAVLDVHAVDARPALRPASGGRRPAGAEARVLLRRGAPALRRRERGVAGADRADGATDPLQGRRGVLRDAGADRRAVVGAVPARQPRAARAARPHAGRRVEPSQDRSNVPEERALRRRRRRSRRSASARRSSPCSRPRACRRRSPRPASCRRTR